MHPLVKQESVPPEAAFAVAVCTRNRADQLLPTLDALNAQTGREFDLLVVEQSDALDPAVERACASHPRTRLLKDAGRGLSRARNVASRELVAEWIVFVDDDCRPEPAWAERLGEELAAHPEADFVSGHVGAGGAPEGDYAPVTTYPVERDRSRRGRWTPPYWIGFGVCMAVRRSTIERLGGWDERLGPGVPDFPAADDMDFNYRLLRAGGVAHASPRPRAVHDQWRRREDLPPLWHGYMAAWAGFSIKHLKTGDVAGGVWLWLDALVASARVLVGALRRSSRLSWRIGMARMCGLAEGTRKALARRW